MEKTGYERVLSGYQYYYDDGCDLCNNGRLDIFGIENNLICVTNGVDGFTDKEKFKFCPKCGRKLVSE